MTNHTRHGLIGIALAAVLASSSSAPAAGPDGQLLYLRRCASCHGVSGRGDGPDAMLFVTRPRNLHEGFLGAYPTPDLVARILDGRALPLALDPAAMRARAEDVETLVAYLQRLPTIDWPAADPGEALYDLRCASCHGDYGAPGGDLPPGVRPPRNLSDPAFQRDTSDAGLAEAVRHGRAGMPALVPRLTDAEARQVATFVRLLSPGFTTYTQYCATCHGGHGIPGGSFGEAFPLPTAAFDRAYFAHHDPEELRRRAWHMLDEHRPAMPHWRGTLSDAEAAAIVAWLKQTDRPPTPGRR